MKIRRRELALAVVLLLCVACRNSSPPKTAAKPTDDSAAPAAPAVRHRSYGNGPSPAIVRITPDTLPVRSGHAVTERYTLEYDILGIEKVERGRIVLYSPGAGQLQAFDFAPIAHGTLEFTLDAGDFDFGPTLRVRAKCPQGTTEWYTFGSLPMDYNDRSANVFRIGNVTPPYLARPMRDFGPGAGEQITMWGPQLNRDCTVDADLDGASIELKNVLARDKQIQALVLHSDLQGRPVAARYVEVKLQLFGKGIAVEDIAHLTLREL